MAQQSEQPTAPLGDYRIKLVSAVDGSTVTFNNTPTISESGSVEYNAVTPIHMPGSIQIFKQTNSRSFKIDAEFISRSRSDATVNLVQLQFLRAWRYPYFGIKSSTTGLEPATDVYQQSNLRSASTSIQNETESVDNTKNAMSRLKGAGAELLGAPPEVLYLYGYSAEGNSSRSNGFVNINRIPVVVNDLQINYPKDVDYIPSLFQSNEPVPIKISVSISLLETHSPAEYERFSLSAFKMGNLSNF